MTPETEPTGQLDLWIVGSLNKTITIEALGIRRIVDIGWSKGMVGALPAFRNKEDAERYAGDKYPVWRAIA